MKSLLSIFFLLSFGILNGQDLDKFKSLFKDLEMLSADEMEGRKTGTEGSTQARRYILKRFEELGIKSFREPPSRNLKSPEP